MNDYYHFHSNCHAALCMSCLTEPWFIMQHCVMVLVHISFGKNPSFSLETVTALPYNTFH